MPCVRHSFYALEDRARMMLYLTDDTIVHLIKRRCLIRREDLLDGQHILQQHRLVTLGGR